MLGSASLENQQEEEIKLEVKANMLLTENTQSIFLIYKQSSPLSTSILHVLICDIYY